MKEELRQKEELMISQSRQAAMGDMIAMIAHQWRQPLTVVAMAANNIKADITLGEPITNEQLDRMSDDILYQTEHLSKTIDDFRNFFRPHQERTKTTLRKVLNDTMNIIGKSLQNNNIEVLISGTCTQGIETYPNQLLQVLLNLINNAKDALKESEQKNARVDITIKESSTEVVLTICDNGGGIPKEILSRLGEPYVSSKVQSGTGLGIYMSKIIVEQHLGGLLSWENREGGACFTVTLPLKKGENHG
jgi:two-component system CheB/CheR fusion protein